jgi:hypothetical protein
MHTDGTDEKRDKTKSADHGFGTMGKRMSEMMSACCAGQGGLSDCSAMMKGMTETMKNQPCCKPGTGPQPRRRKNERVKQ